MTLTSAAVGQPLAGFVTESLIQKLEPRHTVGAQMAEILRDLAPDRQKPRVVEEGQTQRAGAP